MILSALLSRAFPNVSGVLLLTRSTGKLFNLARLRAKTKVQRVLVREMLYADDAAFVSHSETVLQTLCSVFAAACEEFGLKISIKKTVVLTQPASLSPVMQINNDTLA